MLQLQLAQGVLLKLQLNIAREFAAKPTAALG
jgi:hypothetical protein